MTRFRDCHEFVGGAQIKPLRGRKVAGVMFRANPLGAKRFIGQPRRQSRKRHSSSGFEDLKMGRRAVQRGGMPVAAHPSPLIPPAVCRDLFTRAQEWFLALKTAWVLEIGTGNLALRGNGLGPAAWSSGLEKNHLLRG